jgi:hypothetical protein
MSHQVLPIPVPSVQTVYLGTQISQSVLVLMHINSEDFTIYGVEKRKTVEG